jgi:hypothetical protein
MEGWNFVDLATKAKELGTSEGALRARILSGQEICFIYLSNARTSAEYGGWLPPWSEESFPFVDWMDHGSPMNWQSGGSNGNPIAPHIPWYHVSGWVGLDRLGVDAVLTRGECKLNGPPVYVCDGDMNSVCCLRVHAEPKKEWIKADSYEEGGYWRDLPIMLTANDLFLAAKSSSHTATLSSRKEQSYLGIIAAMRALLRDKDGGGFPSEAKIIEQLVSRFNTIDGVSKRNLESVFASATRAAGEISPSK